MKDYHPNLDGPAEPIGLSMKPEPERWYGCYDDSWKGIITSESFSHPAKFSRRLVEKILDYLQEKGWIEKGCILGDPFGGVGTGGIIAAYRGYRWIGNELESKFCKLARGHMCAGYTKAEWRQMYGRFGRFDQLCPTCQRTAGQVHNSRVIPTQERHYFQGNFDLHRDKWERLKVPAPVMNRGDSRQFDEIVHAILTSPPYVSGGHHTDVMNAGNQNGRGQARAVITSPPYSGSLDDGGPEKQHPDGYPRSNNWTGYGKSEGQIAALKSGDVDAVVTSPPFLGARSDTTNSSGGITKDGYKGKHRDRPSQKTIGARTYGSAQDTPRSEGNIETAPAGDVDAIVSSPPYETIAAGAGGLNTKPPKHAGQQSGRAAGASQDTDQRYGSTPGQIADAAKGSVDAIVSSPPYDEGLGHGGNSPRADKLRSEKKLQEPVYGNNTPGQISAAPKSAGVDAIVSSPPYADSVNSQSHGIDFSKGKTAEKDHITPRRLLSREANHTERRYGATPGQIGALPTSKVDAVVSSPPWEANSEGGRATGKFKGDAVLKSKRGKGATDAAVRAQAERDQHKTYGESEGQIGQTRGQTYWEAMARVYLACFRSLRAGGVICIVVKDFCKDGRRMPLCDDTVRLLTWCGFQEVERIHAMLTSTRVEDDLFEGEQVVKTERKSFFRRLHESKLAPDDPRRIDFEEVLVFRKP